MSDPDERVEELEAKVERLEATIQGLTEELVEVHDRLETLEGTRADATESGESRARNSTKEGRNDGSKNDEPQEEDETGDDSGLGDDIIVA